MSKSDWLIFIIYLSIGMWLNFELLPIPAKWASGMPPNLLCDFYIVGKRGVHCAIEPGIFHNPTPSIACVIIITFISRFLFGKDKFIYGAYIFIAPLVGVSGFISLLNFASGYGAWQYGLFALSKLSFALPFCLIGWMSGKNEKRRQEKLNQGIETEIAERLKEKSKKSKQV
ncbi:hypothetical protein [Chromobacterium amazonense]|uniref:hypothetical protein n=1 Tax=Chromobacterium amazonense TaxID=1382803 RepID=UPI003F7938B2